MKQPQGSDEERGLSRTQLMRASLLPLYHLPLMTLLVMLMFSINPMIYVLDQLQEHVPS
jgi:hypothetical protein